jgi:hypothetical protein
MKLMLLLQSIGAPESLAEDAEILLRQQADSDNLLVERLRQRLMLGHRRAGTTGASDLCRELRVELQKFDVNDGLTTIDRAYVAVNRR